MTTNSFKHSGTHGDLLYSLPIVQYFGGGDFYLHLGQIDWIGERFYGSKPSAFHQGRMNAKDFEFIKDFMRAQKYITKFDVLDPKTSQITHNLDRFRPPFVGHPGNYVDIYADVFNLKTSDIKEHLRNTIWLTVPTSKVIEGRDIMINRTTRWLPPTISPIWNDWKQQGLEARSFFVGLPDEYVAFKQQIGWNIPHQPVLTLLEMAQYIQGVEVFIGNQSAGLSVAIGLGKDDIWCEARRDMPIERNECYFPKRDGLHYF